MQPRQYLAFELATLSGLTPAQTASITGLSRNAVYKARRRVVARLKELAGEYASEGVLTEQVKKSLSLMLDGAAQRQVTSRIRDSLQEQ